MLLLLRHIFESNLRMSEPQKESRLRSLIKGLTWRVVATSTIIAIAYYKTGDITFALEVGAIEFVIKLALYYIHERAWQLAPRGTFRRLFKKKN